MIPVAPSTPRVDLTSRKQFVATHDPWAARVKQEAAAEQQEREAAKQRLLAQQAQHREELLAQIERRQQAKGEEKVSKIEDIQSVNETYREFLQSRDSHRQSYRQKNAIIAQQRQEQLRLLEERRRAEQAAVEQEAARLREEAIALMEEEKAKLRAKRRRQAEIAEESHALNEQMRKEKLRAKQERLEQEVKEMDAYCRTLEAQDIKRQEHFASHLKVRAPGKLNASSDKFEAPKYRQYFASVERAAEEKRLADEAAEREKKLKAKLLSEKCMSEIQDQMQRKAALRRQRLVEDARDRALLEHDAERWSASVSSTRERHLQQRAAHAHDLEMQMVAARQRELLEETRGPHTAR